MIVILERVQEVLKKSYITNQDFYNVIQAIVIAAKEAGIAKRVEHSTAYAFTLPESKYGHVLTLAVDLIAKVAQVSYEHRIPDFKDLGPADQLHVHSFRPVKGNMIHTEYHSETEEWHPISEDQEFRWLMEEIIEAFARELGVNA